MDGDTGGTMGGTDTLATILASITFMASSMAPRLISIMDTVTRMGEQGGPTLDTGNIT